MRRIPNLLMFGAILLGAACDAARDAVDTTIPPPTARPATTTTVDARPPPGPAADPRAAVPPAPDVQLYELARTPPGYAPGVVSKLPGSSTVTYLPLGSRDPLDGRRISVQAIPTARPSPAEGYVTIDRVAVRGGREAAFFLVGDRLDDGRARHGLSWSESDTTTVSVYAFSADIAYLRSLADMVRPARG